MAERPRRVAVAAADRDVDPLLARATSSFIAGGGRSAGLIASVAVGLGLIAVARGLSRGKRRAWAIATVLFAVAAVVHLIHGPDPITVVLSAAMLVALIWFRDDFRAHGDPGSLQQAVLFVPVYLVGVFLFTWITLFAERAHVSPDLSFGGIVETAYKGMIGLDGPYTYGRKVFADFFEISLIVLGVVGLLILLYLVLRTFVQADPPSADRRGTGRGDRPPVGRRHARLLRPAARQELLLLRPTASR